MFSVVLVRLIRILNALLLEGIAMEIGVTTIHKVGKLSVVADSVINVAS
ncbi:MAG: hypothetical protein GX799_01590 [Crenarchaeota archaeon]|nr:hypothetical protein [Thermoproteota archaeon]